MDRINYLEEQLAREHQLRETTDGYILDLQTARQEAVTHISKVKDGQRNVTRHLKAVRLVKKN